MKLYSEIERNQFVISSGRLVSLIVKLPWLNLHVCFIESSFDEGEGCSTTITIRL